jgi:hypothetical protein
MAILGALLRGAAQARAGQLEGRQLGEAEGYRRQANEAQASLAKEKAKADQSYRTMQAMIRYAQELQTAKEREADNKRLDSSNAERARHNRAMEAASRDRAARAREAREARTVDQERVRTKEMLGSTERQIDDTRSDLSRAQREIPEMPLTTQVAPADSTRFENEVRAPFRARADSIQHAYDTQSAKRDSLLKVLGGEKAPRQPQGAVRDMAGYQDALAVLAERRNDLLTKYPSPEARAQIEETYRQEIERVSREFGALPPDDDQQ